MKLRLLVSLKNANNEIQSLRDQEKILAENQKEYSTLEEAKQAKRYWLWLARECGRADDTEVIIATVDQGD